MTNFIIQIELNFIYELFFYLSTLAPDERGWVNRTKFRCGRTITSGADRSGAIQQKFEEKRTHQAKKNVLFNNTHVRVATIAKFIGLGYELLLHPPYFPNLVPINNFRFLNLKI